MSAYLVNKARDNRFAALKFLRSQNSKLVSISGHRLPRGAKVPLPAFGHASIRVSTRESAAA